MVCYNIDNLSSFLLLYYAQQIFKDSYVEFMVLCCPFFKPHFKEEDLWRISVFCMADEAIATV